MQKYDIIIAGAGIAGIRAAEQARAILPDASIAIINGEDRLPYKRTKLSKNIASGFATDQFALYPSEWYSEQDIDLYNGHRLEKVDTDTHILSTDQGQSLEWGRLVLCTGARTHIPAEYTLPDPYTDYFARDTERLSRIRPGQALVVGTGVLGIETADQLAKKGHTVTLAGVEPPLMSRQLNIQAARMLQERMAGRGIRMVFTPRGQAVDITGYDSVILCSGTFSPRDIDIDIEYDQAWLVDQFMQSSHSHVFAGGDGARMRDGYRSHLWHGAEHSGMAAGANAARSLKGEALVPYIPLPWRLKCEVFGQYYFSINYHPRMETELRDIVEQKEGDIYRCFYFKEGRITSIIMANEKERAKWYQQAVQQGMGKDEFLEGIV